MEYQAIKKGRYTARIINYGIGESSKGSPRVEVLFELDEDGTSRQITWYGYLTDKAADLTLKQLLVLGLQGNDPLSVADGIDGGALDPNVEVTLDIENEVSPQDGKTYAKVKWVNRSAANRFANAMKRKEAEIKLGALNLKGRLAAVRMEEGIPDKPRTLPAQKAVGQTSSPFSSTEDDLPF